MQRVNNKSDITNQYGKNFQILIGSISTIHFGPCTYVHTHKHACTNISRGSLFALISLSLSQCYARIRSQLSRQSFPSILVAFQLSKSSRQGCNAPCLFAGLHGRFQFPNRLQLYKIQILFKQNQRKFHIINTNKIRFSTMELIRLLDKCKTSGQTLLNIFHQNE